MILIANAIRRKMINKRTTYISSETIKKKIKEANDKWASKGKPKIDQKHPWRFDNFPQNKKKDEDA